MPRPLALLLGDGRFPTGGHAHSSGLERAVACGSVSSVDDETAPVATARSSPEEWA